MKINKKFLILGAISLSLIFLMLIFQSCVLIANYSKELTINYNLIDINYIAHVKTLIVITVSNLHFYCIMLTLIIVSSYKLFNSNTTKQNVNNILKISLIICLIISALFSLSSIILILIDNLMPILYYLSSSIIILASAIILIFTSILSYRKHIK